MAQLPNLGNPPPEYQASFFSRMLRDLTLYLDSISRTGPVLATSIRATGLTGASTLSGAITDTDTAITLANADKFPAFGSGTIVLERIQWTGKTGNTLTGVTRGAYGSTAVSHSSGTVIVASATSGDLYADPTTNALYVVT